ncbi:unnamed protein product [Didymodactylos carnosus]|uniref:Retrotransposon gag domain-containing protein n=1 Tax=Didymodactylos carnosus TaxID=1234261 RepID=A0A8S2EGA8_9BILA|nr:unnamed protein product [Didymodactylos carnosus]CAF3939030.1 unnamed protein product [Didymodactylos carnosus]
MILKNLNKFSGYNEDRNSWLISVISVFEQFKVVQFNWITYIPLLLTGQARIWYAVSRSRISDFDTFVANFLMEFETKPRSSSGSADSNVTTTSVPLVANGSPLIVRQDPVELNLIKSLNNQVIRKLKSFSGKQDNIVTWIDDLEAQFKAHGWTEDVKLKYILTVLQELTLK